MNRKSKIVFTLALATIMMLSICACKNEKAIIKLDAPYKFLMEDTVIQWDEVDNAKDYTVKINEIEYIVQANNFDLQILPSGLNRVQVRANSYETKKYSFQQSDYSECLNIKKLTAPKSVYLHSELSWASVQGAQKYLVEVRDEERKLLYENIVNTTALASSNFMPLLEFGKRYFASVKAIASEDKNTVQDGLMVFAIINSSGSDYFFNTTNKLTPPQFLQLDQQQDRLLWQSVKGAAGYNIVIKNQNAEIVYSSNAQKNDYGYFLSLSQLGNCLTPDSNYELYLQANVPDAPMWNYEDYHAIYSEKDSDYKKFDLDIDFNVKLPTVHNLRFYGETSYITSILWDKVKGASEYKFNVISPDGVVVYSTITSNNGFYIADSFNPIIRSLVDSGEYSFSVQALINDNNNLYAHENKIVKFNQDSDCSDFKFFVNADAILDNPYDLKIGTRYVGGEITWSVKSNNIGLGGFKITIRDNDNNIVYISGTNSNIILVSDFVNYLKTTGKYTITVQAFGAPVIGHSGIKKPKDSDEVEMVFNFDIETGKISTD